MTFGERLYKIRKDAKKQLSEIKVWWTSCPAKPVVSGLMLLLASMAVVGIYEPGVVFGRLLYGILF